MIDLCRRMCCVLALVAGAAGLPLAAEEDGLSVGRVEAVFVQEHRAQANTIKLEFAEAGLENVHLQFMKAGRPPTNVGMGPSVSVARAQAALRLAKRYNGAVTILLPERLFPAHYIAIASSSFDDTVEYQIDEATMKELENPALTTEQFHELYRRLTPADHPPVKKGRVF
ncbi:MAG: hypothetical protein U0361_08550 [Nitrospiraceae bacterium]